MPSQIKLIVLARKFGFSPDYFADQAKAGRLKAMQVGRIWYSTEADVEEFMRTLPGPGRPSRAGMRPPPPKERFERPVRATQRRNEEAKIEAAALEKLQEENMAEIKLAWAAIGSESAVRLKSICPKKQELVDGITLERERLVEARDPERRKARIEAEKALVKTCSCGTIFNSAGGAFDRCHKCRGK